MEVPFEATKSFCYRFARYQAIPEILELPEVAGGEPFRLVEVAKQVIDRHLTAEQQSVMLKKAKSEGEDSVLKTVKFFIPYVARNTGQLFVLGGGMFRLPRPEDTNEEDVEEAVQEEEDEEQDDESDGSIYAFSFPALVKENAPFPIKIGRTTGSVEDRVKAQCKGSATFDNPVIVKYWKVKRVNPVEASVHSILKARGRWRENVPGYEWFDTTVAEIEAIIKFTVGQ